MTLFDFAWKNISRDKRSYIYYFTNCVFSVFIFFLFSVLSFHPNMKIIDQQSTMGIILMLSEGVTIMFTLCFISYSVSSFLRGRSKQFGLITIMGASKKQLNKLIFMENMIVGAASIITGILFGLVFSKLFLAIANKAIGVEGFGFYFPVKSILITVVVLGILFFTISYFIPKFVRKEKIIKLIKAENIGEKKQNLIPMLVCFIILFLGDIWVATSDSALAKGIIDNIFSTIPLAITIVLGTYLLFALGMAGSIVITEHGESYFKNTKILSFSNMKSTLRANSQSMTLTAILYAISFFAIIVLFASAGNVLSETQKITPYAFTYIPWQENVPVNKHLNIIEDELKDLPGYKKLSFDLYKMNEDLDRAIIMPHSQYNEIMAFMGKEPIDVGDKEVYLVSGNVGSSIEDIPEEIQAFLKEKGLNLTVAGKSDTPIMLTGYVDSISVVSDAVFDPLKSDLGTQKVYAYNIDNWYENTQSYEHIESALSTEKENRELSLISAYFYYSSNKTQNNLMLYIGSILCFAFILAVASFVYSRLYSEIENECKKYRGIVKMGLSKKELSTISGKLVKLLLIAPFIVAIVYMWIGVLLVEKSIMVSNVPTAFYCTIIFALLQAIFYLLVKNAYHKAIFKRVYEEI